MSFKAISFSLLAVAALMAQPAFAQTEGGGLAAAGGGTIAGVSVPLVTFTVVAVGTVATANKDTATATATATR